MRLIDVLPRDIAAPQGAAGIDVIGITAASGSVAPGMIFAALPGARADGAKFIPDAIARGACAIIASEHAVAETPPHVPLIRVTHPRRALALIAACLFPGQPGTAVAVTGTSGKTSVADFTRQIFTVLGRPAASLGTIGLIKPGNAIYGSLTTPDPVTLHQTLDGLAREGVTHLAFEASSHGLDQHRLDGVRLSAAAFTNLGRDHMDYHPSVEHYLGAKLRLFTELLERGKPAVINADGAYAEAVIGACRAHGLEILTVGRAGQRLKLLDVALKGFEQVLIVATPDKRYEVRLPLIGGYQVENALVAAGLAIATGEDEGQVLAAVSKLKGVPGRLEIAGAANGGLAIVDYAHKPEALEAALAACRPFVSGKLICVFGCGGDRDQGKRPIMGKIASEQADVVIVTDDNPRSEEPAVIRRAIVAGATRSVEEIGDRAQAIRAAIARMGKGDVVLIAGKGHETGQIVGSTVIPFSDHDAVAHALEQIARNG